MATIQVTPPVSQGNGSLDSPLLIDAVRPTLEPDDSSYILTATHLNPIETQFNTTDSRPTKSVKISGVRVIWDRGKDYRKQMGYQGAGLLDLKTLEIIADQVIIRVPLRFPKTDVTIYARELIFEGKGCIDTTPIPFATPALSACKTAEGYPADRSGKATYLTMDGKHGEKAGDIHLYINNLIDLKPGEKRFICKGSKGQAAEKGGLRPYEPNGANQPAADKGKDVKPVTCVDVSNYVENVTVNHRCDTWRWAGEVDHPTRMPMTEDALKQNKVVHARIVLLDTNVFTANVRRTFLPSMSTVDSNSLLHLVTPGVKNAFVEGERVKYEGHQDDSRLRPGDGENAYPSGKPGNGGGGGSVISYLGNVTLNPAHCIVAPGDPGDPSESIRGGTPGEPKTAFWMELRIVRKDFIPSPHGPTVSLANVSAKAGKDAAGRSGTQAPSGKVESRPGSGPLWLHPQALGSVITYARDAYRNGHRAEARTILEPYYLALGGNRKSLPSLLLGRFSEMESMLSNMNNNLDYYGNAPGWLPRLDVRTNYQIWHLFSQESSKVLYFAQKMEQDWDRFEDEQEALSQTADALMKELDVTAVGLDSAYKALKSAKEALDSVQAMFEAKRRDIDFLRNQAKAEAATMVKEQQIFNGMMKVIGGLAESIPVAQPFLGMAGKTLSLAGDFDWNKPDASAQFGTFFKQLSSQTKDFLEDNDELFVARSSSGILKPEGSIADLKSQIRAAKGAVESFDETVTSHVKTVDAEWGLVKNGERDRIKGEIAEVNASIASLKSLGKDAEQQTKQMTALEKELAETVALKLGKSKAKLYADLATLDNQSSDQAKEQIRQKRALVEKVEALEKKKAEVDTQSEKYKEEKAVCEKQTTDLLSSLSGLSSGIAHLGKGVAALTAACDDKEVDRLTEQILKGSKFRDSYLKLLAEVRELNQQKSEAVAIFCLQQQLISTYTGRISSAMLELNALSTQRQVADSVLDPGIKEYLRNMQARAKENLLWSQYHFLKAWQYEYLQDLGDDFYNLDQWVERLRDFERQKAGLGKKKFAELTDEDRKRIANTFLTAEDFEEIGDTVRKGHTLDLVKRIIAERQHYVGQTKNTFDCVLSPRMCRQLCDEGKVTFNLVDDFGKGSFRDVQGRISTINLEVFKIETSDQSLSVSVEFVHSGTSVQLGSDKKYYKFQKAVADNPILWGFVYNHSDYLRLKAEDDDEDQIWSHTGKKPIKKDEEVSEPDSAIIEAEFDEKLKYKEHAPSSFSNMTLWLNRGQYHDVARYHDFLARLTEIQKVQFSVEISKKGTI